MIYADISTVADHISLAYIPEGSQPATTGV